MFESLALGAVAVAGIIVIGILVAEAALVCWLFVLPIKMLGLIFRGFALILLLPLVLAVGIAGVVVFGAGMLLFMLPVFPLLLLVGAIWWFARRGHRSAARI